MASPGAETPRWNQTDWIVGGMVIISLAAIPPATVIDRYSRGAGK